MIKDILGKGQAEAKSGRELANILNCDIRTIADKIAKERREGAPICANMRGASGYYLARNKEELNEYIGRLKGRIVEYETTERALIAAADDDKTFNN